MLSKRWILPWSLMSVLVLLLLLLSLRYFVYGAEAYFPRQREIYEAKAAWLLLHIGGMMVAAAVGPFQFLPGFRDRHRKLHRAMGRLYLAGCLVGGLGGLYMARYSAAGVVSDVAFSLLALGLLFTTAKAFLAIKSGRVDDHRNWMTRSFALVLGAVTLRLYAPFLEGAFGEQDGYAIVSWVSWVPNLVAAEWLIRRRRAATPGRRPSAAAVVPGEPLPTP